MDYSTWSDVDYFARCAWCGRKAKVLGVEPRYQCSGCLPSAVRAVVPAELDYEPGYPVRYCDKYCQLEDWRLLHQLDCLRVDTAAGRERLLVKSALLILEPPIGKPLIPDTFDGRVLPNLPRHVLHRAGPQCARSEIDGAMVEFLD
jgi:hypothetical protein